MFRAKRVLGTILLSDIQQEKYQSQVTPLWNPVMTLIRFEQIVLQFDTLCSTCQIGPQLQQTVKHPVENLGKVSVHAVNLPTIFDFADDADSLIGLNY
jgi:hypothetical protein